MFVRSVRGACRLYDILSQSRRKIQQPVLIHSTSRYSNQANESSSKDSTESQPQSEVVVRTSFEDIKDKTKDSYLEMIKIFINREAVHRRGHVEFIYSAMKNMESFGVVKDLEVYKALIDVLPKGKFVARNMLQVEFMHYPKQQQCIIDLLEQMEDNGVMPDYEIQDMLMNIFGNKTYPLRKYWRMMYWMPKFKNLSPWLLPKVIPNSTYELAKLAIERISSVDPQVQITTYQSSELEDSIDDAWIISAQSPTQQKLLHEYDSTQPVYVEGSFRVWLKNNPVNYFILRGKPKPVPELQDDGDDVSKLKVSFFDFTPPVKKELIELPSVHEQADGIILAICATETSSKDSLLSWIRHLEKCNPALSTLNVVFTLRTGSREIAPIVEEKPKQIDEK